MPTPSVRTATTGKSRPSDQRSYGEAHILTKHIEPRTGPHITNAFFNLFDPTHLEAGCPASLVNRHAACDLFFHQKVGIAVDFVAEVALDLPAAEEIAHKVTDSCPHSFEGRHHASSTGRNARPIATAMRSQFFVSAFS
jgi:hypothetical protein